MKIPEFYSVKEQMAMIGKHKWYVSRLFELSRDFEVMEVPLNHLNIYSKYSSLTLRDMVMHFNAVKNADLNFPIILDEDGELMDGRHRIMKALMEGRETIKVVRFDENPQPCEITE